MKHITNTTALAGVALLALTACGGDDVGDDPTPEPKTTTEAAVEPQESTAAEDQEPAADESTGGAEDESVSDREGVAPKDMDFSDDPILADREFTGRMTGDVVASVGEAVEIDKGAFEGIGNYIGTVTLDELVAGPECYGATDEVYEPENGHWLMATFTLTTDVDSEEEMDLSEADFRWSGFNEPIATGNAWLCQDDLGGLADSVRNGESAQRTLVFDIPEFEGTLTYRGATNYVDWEIERDDYENAENLPAE